MGKFKTGLSFIQNFFGFKRNTKTVREYLNDANIRSSIYMAFIIIILEVWMIFRQVNKYVAPNWGNEATFAKLGVSSNLGLIFMYTSLYFLFIMCSLAMMVFAINYLKKKQSLRNMITNLVVGGLCVLWGLLLIPENKPADSIGLTTLVLLYVAMPIFGLTIIGYTLYRFKTGKISLPLSVVCISMFALICLLFGIKVGYSDFAHTTVVTDPGFRIDKVKMITCFLTMIIFVACLLIWKPYISIILLTGIFVLFRYLLVSYPNRPFLEADEINYYTFLISLTMISLSIYHQRVNEAKKDEKLMYDAAYDILTGVHNLNYLTYTVSTNQKEEPQLCENKVFLFVNLTNFKAINIQRGFEAGNKFIIQLGKDIESVFDGDIVARQSDDHFVIYTDLKYYQDKINLLDEIIKKRVGSLYIQLKIGGYIPKINDNPFRAIDRARYACGLIGNKYGVNFLMYDERVRDTLIKHQYIINHLDEAIENGYIQPYYQPVVWSKNRELCGAEALARWIDPIYGFLAPAEFVPILEESRLIHKLDKCIIDNVCKNMRIALDEGRPVVPVSVNFSRLDFELMNVSEVLNTALQKYNISKEYIHVEITESALAGDTDFLNEVIAKLKEDGFAIWLDDFGSGYSSLNVLKDFIFDVIKIDMKFLSNFENNDKSKDILDCIIQLADRLGMKTLTEGVETKEEADFLESIGCGRLQGYLFGKPYKLEDFEKMIDIEKLKVSTKIL